MNSKTIGNYMLLTLAISIAILLSSSQTIKLTSRQNQINPTPSLTITTVPSHTLTPLPTITDTPIPSLTPSPTQQSPSITVEDIQHSLQDNFNEILTAVNNIETTEKETFLEKVRDELILNFIWDFIINPDKPSQTTNNIQISITIGGIASLILKLAFFLWEKYLSKNATPNVVHQKTSLWYFKYPKIIVNTTFNLYAIGFVFILTTVSFWGGITSRTHKSQVSDVEKQIIALEEKIDLQTILINSISASVDNEQPISNQMLPAQNQEEIIDSLNQLTESNKEMKTTLENISINIGKVQRDTATDGFQLIQLILTAFVGYGVFELIRRPR